MAVSKNSIDLKLTKISTTEKKLTEPPRGGPESSVSLFSVGTNPATKPCESFLEIAMPCPEMKHGASV